MATIHARSFSLPTSSHPFITNAEEHLQRLKTSGDACQKLDELRNLYECVDDVLQLPLSQQILSHERSGKWEEEILDGSLRLLDICGAVRDIYSQMKESVHDLESSLRRKRCGDLENEMETYRKTEKHLNKVITKCYREMKNLAEIRKDSESETIPLVQLMKQVQEVSVNVLESTLSLISPSKAGSSGWSLVSKLLHSQQKRANSSSHIPLIQKVQAGMKSYEKGDASQKRKVVKSLEETDSGIQELAEVLDIVFRLLLKTRVSLLNILNH